jgi:hypothetical protein
MAGRRWGLRGTQHVIEKSEMACLPLLMQGWMEKMKADPRLDHSVYLELFKHL